MYMKSVVPNRNKRHWRNKWIQLNQKSNSLIKLQISLKLIRLHTYKKILKIFHDLDPKFDFWYE